MFRHALYVLLTIITHGKQTKEFLGLFISLVRTQDEPDVVNAHAPQLNGITYLLWSLHKISVLRCHMGWVALVAFLKSNSLPK